MTTQQDVAEAMQRATSVFTRRPDMGVHADASARAIWHGGTRISAHHAMGMQMETDMPCELGGSGDRVSPGWLFRAGIAACCATAIGMVAASEGVELDALEIEVGSESDTRGLLGMQTPSGDGVQAGPLAMQIAVRIHAARVDEARLRQIVERGLQRSPMQAAMQQPPPIEIRLTINDSNVD